MSRAGQRILLMNTSGHKCFLEGQQIQPGEFIEMVLAADFASGCDRQVAARGPWGRCGWTSEEIKQVAREIRHRHTRRVIWRREGTKPTWRDYQDYTDAPYHTVTGTLKVLPEVWSPQLGNQRDILVYLPPSYERGDRAYPVLYMHDGQNLFDDATSFSCEWAVDETLEAASASGLETIVVGIPNMQERRCDEYSPFVDRLSGGGQGAAYLEFIVHTLKPLIDDTFRTVRDREHTGIFGSSMGGLISLYGFFAQSATFGFAGVMSPALWFADRALFAAVRQAAFVPGRLYLDVGTREGRETVANARRMCALLRRKGYRPGQELQYVEEHNAGHCETAWGGRLRGALHFLLHGATPRPVVQPELSAATMPALQEIALGARA
ncbi:MAG TPA: alpha/beta hydrolase-fold protein [Herpetosiphonaceae bacterium]